MDQRLNIDEEIPAFYGAIILELPVDKKEDEITHLLGKDVSICDYDDIKEVTYIEISKTQCWELDDFLSSVFEKCELKQLKKVSEQLHAQVWVCISFYHKKRFPALIIESENMEIIRELKACISIDPY